MDGEEIRWLEKVFKQHKEDQRIYLDNKFTEIDKNFAEIKTQLSEDKSDCLQCREKCQAAVNENLQSLNKKIDNTNASINKKIVYGGAVAVIIALLLWTAFGTNALSYIISLLGKASSLPGPL